MSRQACAHHRVCVSNKEKEIGFVGMCHGMDEGGRDKGGRKGERKGEREGERENNAGVCRSQRMRGNGWECSGGSKGRETQGRATDLAVDDADVAEDARTGPDREDEAQHRRPRQHHRRDLVGYVR